MQSAIDHLQSSIEIKEEDEARLSPLGYGHIIVLSHYLFTLTKQETNGKLRQLNQPSDDIDPLRVTFRTVGLQTPLLTSHQIAVANDEFTGRMLSAINDLMLDIGMSH